MFPDILSILAIMKLAAELCVGTVAGLKVECNGTIISSNTALAHVNCSSTAYAMNSSTPEFSSNQPINYMERMKRAETILILITVASVLTISVLAGLLWRTKRRRQIERTVSVNEFEANSESGSQEMLPVGVLGKGSPPQKRKDYNEDERTKPEQLIPLVNELGTPIDPRKVRQIETGNPNGDLAIGQEFKGLGKSNIEKTNQIPEESGNIYSMEPTSAGPLQEESQDTQSDDFSTENEYEYPQI